MMIRFALVLLLVATHAQAQATRPTARVVWQERHAVRGLKQPAVLLRGPSGDGFRVVGWSAFATDPEDDKSWRELWWIMTLDGRGRRTRLDEFPEKPNQARVEDAFARGDETVVTGGMLPWLARVDGDGKPAPPVRIRRDDRDLDVVVIRADRDDTFLAVGCSTGPPKDKQQRDLDVWLARVTLDGTVRWERDFGRAEMDMACAVLPMPDGGCVIAANSGKYNKFAQGPTAVWLIRCDAEGNKLAEAAIDGGQVNATGTKYLAPHGDAGGFIVSYTTTQLPPIGRVPLDRPPAFAAHVACFDRDLKPIWNKVLPPTSSFGSLLILRRADGSYAAVGERNHAPHVARFDGRGEVVAEMKLPLNGYFNAADVIEDGDGTVVVGTYRDRAGGLPGQPPPEDDVLLFKFR